MRTANVLIRQKLLSGNMNKLVHAQVLSEKDGVLRVMIQGQRVPTEVKASEVIDAGKIFGKTKQGERPASVLQKSYPTGISALGNILNR